MAALRETGLRDLIALADVSRGIRRIRRLKVDREFGADDGPAERCRRDD
jgi:hypothetical protein